MVCLRRVHCVHDAMPSVQAKPLLGHKIRVGRDVGFCTLSCQTKACHHALQPAIRILIVRVWTQLDCPNTHSHLPIEPSDLPSGLPLNI